MTTEEAPRELRTSPEIGGMGHSVKRKEDPRFIRGAGEYIDDVNLPGQLWLDIVRSPYAHATIKGIDASEALKVPGVLAVITGEDLEKAGSTGCRPSPATSRWCCRPTRSCTRARRSRRSSRPTATPPPTAWLRCWSTTSRCRSWSTRTRRSRATRRSCARIAARTSRTTTSGTGSRATPPRPMRRSPLPMSASRRTSTSRASTWRRSRRAAASPTGTPSAASSRCT